MQLHRGPIAAAIMVLASTAVAQNPWNGMHALSILVHLQDLGDKHFNEGELAGTRGEGRRLEGFAIGWNGQIPGVSIQYMAHIQDVGDTPWAADGAFLGTRGQARRVEGIAIRLVGQRASEFGVHYRCHLQDIGDTRWMSDGEFCGTRGESRRLEGLQVVLVRK